MIIKIIGVLIIVIGFMLKLDTIAVVLVAGLATGLVAGMGFVEILEVLGRSICFNKIYDTSAFNFSTSRNT